MKQRMDAKVLVSAESQAALCSVFANPRRILILWALAKQEQSVTAIAQAISASLQSTSQHLRLMKAAGILEARRDGQTIYYRIANGTQPERCQLLLQVRKRQGKQESPI
jgi:DNA-binding transcriptional ArsR family regulator